MPQFAPVLVETAKGLSAVRGLSWHSDTKKKERKTEAGIFVNGVGQIHTRTHPPPTGCNAWLAGKAD